MDEAAASEEWGSKFVETSGAGEGIRGRETGGGGPKTRSTRSGKFMSQQIVGGMGPQRVQPPGRHML